MYLSDPANNFDPTGRGVEDFVGDIMGSGITALFIVPFAVLFPGVVVPLLVVAAISGCGGNMIGQLATDEMKGEEFSGEDLAWKCASGAVSASIF